VGYYFLNFALAFSLLIGGILGVPVCSFLHAAGIIAGVLEAATTATGDDWKL
jgi:hypothetical protein